MSANLIRAISPGVEMRSAEDGSLTLHGHFARFNEWTEINSVWEGHFMERFVPGAFRKTIQESRDKIQVLFQHGQDPDVGEKPIAAITDLREDDEGAYYEARLFEGLPPLIMEGLRAGKYGASMRFGALREQWDDQPERSEYNPDGIRERSVKEARVPEFGPVTFPAYEGATAGVRSLTDEFIMECMRSNPEKLRRMFDEATTIEVEKEDAPSEDNADEVVTLSEERRVTEPTKPTLLALYGVPGRRSEKEQRSWHRR